jgi:hypothetical protein
LVPAAGRRRQLERRHKIAKRFDNQIERSVLKERTAAASPMWIWGSSLVRNLLMKMLQQPRFANTRLADNRCHLSLALERTSPSI